MLVGNLGVSVWVSKSEVVEFIMASEGVATSVVRAGTDSESGLLNIITTSISEDMHGVDDLLSESFNLGSNFLTECNSTVPKEIKLKVSEFLELGEGVLDESLDLGASGISLILNASLRDSSLSLGSF